MGERGRGFERDEGRVAGDRGSGLVTETGRVPGTAGNEKDRSDVGVESSIASTPSLVGLLLDCRWIWWSWACCWRIISNSRFYPM